MECGIVLLHSIRGKFNCTWGSPASVHGNIHQYSVTVHMGKKSQRISMYCQTTFLSFPQRLQANWNRSTKSNRSVLFHVLSLYYGFLFSSGKINVFCLCAQQKN